MRSTTRLIFMKARAIYSRYKRLGDNIMDENYFPITWREDGYSTSGIEDFLYEQST